MRLREKLNALKKESEAKMPKEAVEIIHRATDDLRKSGLLDRAVKVGDKAPNFSLSDRSGKKITLQVLLSQGPLVMNFYRGRW
jgi:hypothetical protein